LLTAILLALDENAVAAGWSLILAFVGGVAGYAAGRWHLIFAERATILEGRGPLDAIRRSWQLVSEQRGEVLSLLAGTTVIRVATAIPWLFMTLWLELLQVGLPTPWLFLVGWLVAPLGVAMTDVVWTQCFLRAVSGETLVIPNRLASSQRPQQA
jgi:sterol desaturase/sphingolipid hydroxylase (fatty acid hydroxylase superfamily)